MHVRRLTSPFLIASAALVALAAPPALAEDVAKPLTDLDAAVEVAARDDAGAVADDDEANASFELLLDWQTRSLTDYWFLDRDADGDSTSSVNIALAMEQAISDDWTLALLVDGWFDDQDTHWSSSATDSIAFQAAFRRDLGDGWELELGARYDDWNNIHASGGDPYSAFASITYTFEALGGELSPYAFQELRHFVDGDDHDGTWISEVGAEWERELADRWTLDVAAYGVRLDGSRTDPDVWAVGGRAGIAYALCEDVTARVFVEATSARGADPVPGRTIGFVGVQMIFAF